MNTYIYIVLAFLLCGCSTLKPMPLEGWSTDDLYFIRGGTKVGQFRSWKDGYFVSYWYLEKLGYGKEWR